jgi:hypothetical protein
MASRLALPGRGGRVAEGTRLLSEYGVHAPSRVRIPPSPFRSPAAADRRPPPPATIPRHTAPVAQLDRASVYGTEGQRFESSRARHEIPTKRLLHRTSLLCGRRARPDPVQSRWADRGAAPACWPCLVDGGTALPYAR